MTSGDYIILLVFVVLAPLLIMAQLYLLGLKLSEPEKMIKPLPNGPNAQTQDRLLQHKDWLASVNLQYRTAFQFGPMQVLVFQQGDAPRFMVFNSHNRLTYAAESYTPELNVLDTSASRSIGLMPRPGAYAQAFPSASPAEIWERHLAGEAHLSAKFGCQWRPLNLAYEDILIDAAKLRMKYVRAQSLWPARVMYRFFVTRHRLVNRTIAQQFP